MRILFVENHARFARLTTRQFLHEHEVTIVSSSAAARAALNQTFDVVLVDYDLDDGKGDALIGELSQRNQRPRIVAISSHQVGNAALMAAGANMICDKMNFAKVAFVIAALFETP